MKNVLSEALKYEHEVFDDKWIFQPDNANPHRHHLTEEWCRDNSASLIDKDYWPRNSPDLNRLDDFI